MRGVRRNDGYLRGVGRLRLHYRTWEVEEPTAGLIVHHGLFEHSGRYRELGEQLAGHGFSTFAPDARGHGSSEGRRGHIRRFSVLLQDLDRFRREVQGLLPVELPLFLIGHSWGGLISLRYLQEYEFPFHGAVITSPLLGHATPLSGSMQRLINVLNRVLPALPIPHRLDPGDLSHDEERVADYRDDPAIHTTLTPRLFSETSAAMETTLRSGDRLRLPILFLLSGRDHVVDTGRSLDFARSLQADDITVEVLDGMYHEVLQERDRSAVVARIAEWISAHGG